MSEDKPENPPAFPHLNPNFDNNWDKEPQRGGMTLRDYFAAHFPLTLETYLIGVDKEKVKTWKTADALASFSAARFQYADEMLKARQS